MCGIIGYIGERKAQDVILKGLSRLEYRGYDSAGVAILDNGKLRIIKRQGKLKILAQELEENPIKGQVGIGHTRWATHGVPNDINAHPHADCTGRIAVVHNGIIENYLELRKDLKRRGHTFVSDTDTETISHLVEEFYKGDLEQAVKKAIRALKGSYALVVIHEDEPERIIGARCDSPLIVGLGTGENFLASDVPAVLDYTSDVIYLDNHDIVIMTRDGVVIKDADGRIVRKKTSKVKWTHTSKKFMTKKIVQKSESTIASKKTNKENE